jgi:hypothetical protein
MSEGKRNHFIPIVLLRRFASRAERKRRKYWIWQLAADTPPVEISVRDAAVSSHFYGKRESGLERELGLFETRLGSAFQAIDDGEDPGLHSETFRVFVYIQMLRTRALREQFIDTSTRMLDDLFDETTPELLLNAVSQELETNFESYLENEINKLSKVQRKAASILLARPRARETLKRAFMEQVVNSDTKPMLDAASVAMRDPKLISESAASGQIRGLSRVLGGEGIPKSFLPMKWSVVHHQGTGSFVLGDCCVVARSIEGEFGFPIRFGKSWSEMFVPISPDRVLIASRSASTDNSISNQELNFQSAELSRKFIFSSSASDEFRELAASIGNEKFLLPEDELSNLSSEAWDDYR